MRLLLATLMGCTPFTIPEVQTADDGAAREAGVVRLATWNIETVGSPGSQEYDAAIEVMTRIDADVIGINEIADHWDAENMEEMADELHYDHVFIGGADFGSDRNAILSRFPLRDTAALDGSDLSTDAWAKDITRDFVIATVEAPGGSFDFVSMHWKSGWNDDDEFRRVVESKRAAQLARSDLPVVLTGDWNDDVRDNSDYPYTFWNEPNGLASSFTLGLDLWDELDDIGFPNDAFLPLEDAGFVLVDARQRSGTDATRPTSGRRIDYIATLGDLELRGSEVFDCRDEHRSGELVYAGESLDDWTCLDAADHVPVLVDVFLGELEEPREPIDVDTVVPGDLVVNEVLANPDVCADSDGEWVEIRNTTAVPVLLEGMHLVDATGNVGLISAGVIEPGAIAVLGRGDTPCGPAYVATYGRSFSLNNSGDTATLMAGDTVVDEISYTRSGASAGEAWADDGDMWCAGAPTPGEENPVCQR